MGYFMFLASSTNCFMTITKPFLYINEEREREGEREKGRGWREKEKERDRVIREMRG